MSHAAIARTEEVEETAPAQTGDAEAGSPVETENGQAVEGSGNLEPADGGQEGEEAKGVVRLLLAGHFKGVADVRLRINFHEQLMAAEAQSVAPAAVEGARGLAEDVVAELADIAGSEGVTEEQAGQIAEAGEAFAADVEAAVAEFEASGSSETSALSAGLQAAFDALMERVREILATEEAEGSGDGEEAPLEAAGAEETSDPSAEGEATDPALEEPAEPVAEQPEDPLAEEPVIDLAAIEQSLTEVFEAGMSDLTDSVSAASVLPPLSEPSGNGVAYEKFLAIYNDMLNGAPPEPAPVDEEEATDVVA